MGNFGDMFWGGGGKMEKGMLVRVFDGSYSLELCGTELKQSSGTVLIAEGVYQVIATNCVLPAGDSLCGKKTNDTIIISLGSGKIVFIQQRFLAIAHQCNTCPNCGQKL